MEGGNDHTGIVMFDESKEEKKCSIALTGLETKRPARCELALLFMLFLPLLLCGDAPRSHASILENEHWTIPIAGGNQWS